MSSCPILLTAVIKPGSVLEHTAPRGVDVPAYILVTNFKKQHIIIFSQCWAFLHSEWHFHYILIESVWRSYFHCYLAEQAFYLSTSSKEATSGVQWELLPHREQFRTSCVKVRQWLWAPMVGRCSINSLACVLWDRNILLSWLPVIFC